MRSIILLTIFLLITPILARVPRPKVPSFWKDDIRFVYDPDVSDNFNEPELNLSKWDPHGARIPETGCPSWNGPPSSEFPDYSTFFPTTTDTETGDATVKQYRISRRRLLLEMDEKPLEFFTSREYYCNATTFRCNHDETIPCFATDVFGNPKFADPQNTTFRYVLHDKCKKEPYCIPHPEHVTGQPRVYKRFVGAHIVGKKGFKYGYIEVMARLGFSPAVAAAWMHDDHFVDGYCRIIQEPGTPRPKLQCPSTIRSRRWQEIDLLEGMNSEIHRRQYIPNIHLFSGYKGEFTSKTATDNGDGNVGGGPIIVEPGVFRLKNPTFADIPESERRGNDYHYNPGSVYELASDWARRKRRLGVYWSPNEIRFLVDGKEVRRVKNNLIHQPMYLDLSYALNVAWAQEFPRQAHLKQEVKFFHYRRWEVFSRSGEDPPSNLTLDTHQDGGRGFQKLYGYELGGVFGRFPNNDDLTVTLTNPDMPDMMADAMGGTTRVRDYFRGSVRQEGSEMENEKARLMEKGFKPAGGYGNARFASEAAPMTKGEKMVAEAREDRAAEVRNGAAGIVEDAAVTVYEHANPNSDLAGWSTKDGLGMGM